MREDYGTNDIFTKVSCMKTLDTCSTIDKDKTVQKLPESIGGMTYGTITELAS